MNYTIFTIFIGLRYSSILLLITSVTPTNAGNVELSKELADSIEETKKYLQGDYASDFKNIPYADTADTTEWFEEDEGYKFDVHGERDRWIFTSYNANRVRIKDSYFVENSEVKEYYNGSEIKTDIPAGKHTPPITLNYIAAMAPKDISVPDFWQVVWDYSVENIAMLTTLERKNKKGDDISMSAVYWTSQTLEKPSHIVVTLDKEEQKNYGFKRRIILKDIRTGAKKKVTQFHYTKWTDDSAPGDTNIFLDYYGEVRKARNGSAAPLLVHCSQGSGRTGTFMAFDALVARVETNLPIAPSDIREVVKQLRFQRPYQIHEPEQYAFVCKIVELVEPNKFWPVGSWIVETKKRIEKGFEKMSGKLTPSSIKNRKSKVSSMSKDSAQKSGKGEV